MRRILNKLKKVREDDKGSVLPLIAVILILAVGIGVVNFSITALYKKRVTVSNALDAGVTSALASAAEERIRPIYYGETSYCSRGYWATYTDEDGTTYSEWVCTQVTYENTESNKKNYVYLNEGIARNTAFNYFKENLELNDLNVNIIDFTFIVEYDKDRKYDVVKSRNVLRETTDSVVNLVTTPPCWWIEEGLNPNVPPWDDHKIYEVKTILFPRYVKVIARATVEYDVPFGNYVGKHRQRTTIEAQAVKELAHVIK